MLGAFNNEFGNGYIVGHESQRVTHGRGAAGSFWLTF
jgi:hypothetical protein